MPGHWQSFRSDGISSRLWQPSDTWPSRSLNVHKFNKVIPSQATQSYQLQKNKEKILLLSAITISNEGPTVPKWTPNIPLNLKKSQRVSKNTHWNLKRTLIMYGLLAGLPCKKSCTISIANVFKINESKVNVSKWQCIKSQGI